MKRIKVILLKLMLFLCFLSVQSQNTRIEGSLLKWHKITLVFEGEELSENDAYNPFLNYRLNVTFTNGNKTHVVPGFYAADGKASESSSSKGRIWKVHFRPDQIGKWKYEVSFRKGENIAVNDSTDAGQPVAFNATTGAFEVAEQDKNSNDNEAKGRLKYNNERYLQYAESGKPFLKGGADSPENLLGYHEFDQTPSSHKYEPHIADWKPGDPLWKGDKGKGIIGALNYLASKSMNSVYFLTMNVLGDGKDVWPWISENERYRFDCSKLDQWEIVFDHMDHLGLMLHIVLQETENELLLDIGQLGVQRKLYLREMIARFSHHLGVTWNLGEENGPVHWSPKGQDDEDRKAMAQFISENDPFDNFIALHTHSLPKEQDVVLQPLLGNQHLDGPSIQLHHPKLVHEITKKWIKEAQKTDKTWVVNLDEIGPADVGAKPDADDPTHEEVRGPVLWGNLMAGGAGVEWYFGYKFAHMDLNCEDWRSRDVLWDQTKIALDFFHEYLPFKQMHSADDLTSNENDFVFVQNNEIYVIYLPKIEKTTINLLGANGMFSVAWFNPRTGGKLQRGSVKRIAGGKSVDIGFPPNKEGDWVVLITRKQSVPTGISKTMNVVTLDALKDFKFDKNVNEAVYYRDESNGVLAIDASKHDQRESFASAYTVFTGADGLYKTSFISMAENDGESEYIIRVNGTVLDRLVNPKVNTAFSTVVHDIEKVYLYKGDLIQIESKAVTNGEIPENGETAWARGRWSSLKFTPASLSLKEQLKNRSAFEEKNGFLEVEAELFHHKTNNGTKRRWIVQSNESVNAENKVHLETASNNAYIEAWPDTRITHDDPLLHGENFFPIPGIGGIVSYKIKINTPGKYYVWASAYSSGSEDNGVHIGVDEKWPESGARMQWCEGKNQWKWSSAQRVPDNHCGEPNSIYLDFETAGEYVISFSMREDGFEMDRWILTRDNSFTPQ